MSKQDNGGPAFPTFTEQYSYGYDKSRPVTVDPGMTLRDYFAAKAMQGLFSTMEDGPALQRAMKLGGFTNPHDWIADTAYSIADAMLKAREA